MLWASRRAVLLVRLRSQQLAHILCCVRDVRAQALLTGFKRLAKHHTQVIGGAAVLLRFFVLQQLLLLKRQNSLRATTRLGLGARGVPPSHQRDARDDVPFVLRAAVEAVKPSWWRASSSELLGPLLSPLRVQRTIQICPKLFVSPRGELRGPGKVAQTLRKGARLAYDPALAAGGTAAAAAAAAAPRGDTSSTQPATGLGDTAGANEDECNKPASNSTGEGDSKAAKAARMCALNDVAMTSVDKATLPASEFSAGFLQSARSTVATTGSWSCPNAAVRCDACVCNCCKTDSLMSRGLTLLCLHAMP